MDNQLKRVVGSRQEIANGKYTRRKNPIPNVHSLVEFLGRSVFYSELGDVTILIYAVNMWDAQSHTCHGGGDIANVVIRRRWSCDNHIYYSGTLHPEMRTYQYTVELFYSYTLK